MILAGAVLVSVLLILGSGVRQLLAYREHRNLTKRINDLSYVQETYDDYARVQAEEQVYEKLDLATITKNEQLYPLIAQLENELPTTIHVKSIQTDGSLVTLNMEADRKVTVGQMLLNFADVTLLENLSIPSMSEESDEDSGTATWTYTLNAYYTGAFLGEDGHLIKKRFRLRIPMRIPIQTAWKERSRPMNRIKISDSDKRLLLIFCAIVIVACSYFFIFSKGMSKAAKIEEQNTADQAKVQQMEQMEAGLPKVKKISSGW